MSQPIGIRDSQPLSGPLGRLLAVALLLGAAVASGCSQLRLPAIDPTGERLFAPLPTTTTLALPGSGGEDCFVTRGLRRIGDHFRDAHQGSILPPRFPEPAFPEPATPPSCPVPSVTVGPKAKCEPCVPSAACNGSCKTGPPAVLFGEECNLKQTCRLPKQGKRGCILLSPQRIIAPVGGEVVLLSGICGTDGYLQVNEPLEWMLTPE
ncbi:MAG: hypothetical protein MI861_27555, partial [Pirellulales bacterium]|nr:hypothetical protein [Pirellulales bacterium]